MTALFFDALNNHPIAIAQPAPALSTITSFIWQALPGIKYWWVSSKKAYPTQMAKAVKADVLGNISLDLKVIYQRQPSMKNMVK